MCQGSSMVSLKTEYVAAMRTVAMRRSATNAAMD
jgi:hypothetical protein